MSKWSKQTYEMVAEIIAGQIKHAHKLAGLADSVRDTEFCAGQISACHEMAASMCVQFANDNPKFDSQKFLIACGVRQ